MSRNSVAKEKQSAGWFGAYLRGFETGLAGKANEEYACSPSRLELTYEDLKLVADFLNSYGRRLTLGLELTYEDLKRCMNPSMHQRARDYRVWSLPTRI